MVCYYCQETDVGERAEVGTCTECNTHACGANSGTEFHGEKCKICEIFFCYQHQDLHRSKAHKSAGIMDTFPKSTKGATILVRDELKPSAIKRVLLVADHGIYLGVKFHDKTMEKGFRNLMQMAQERKEQGPLRAHEIMMFATRRTDRGFFSKDRLLELLISHAKDNGISVEEK